MSDLLSIATGSGALGGLFGMLGSGLGRVIGLYEMREKRQDRTLEMAHEKDGWAHERDLQILQTEAQLQAARHDLDKASVDGSWQGLSASVAADATLPGGYAWVNAVRALVRPVLTLLVWLIFTVLFFAALTTRLPGEAGQDVIETFVNTVTFAASTALAWWFGDRGPQSVKTKPFKDIP
jgi:hypothetical protein